MNKHLDRPPLNRGRILVTAKNTKLNMKNSSLRAMIRCITCLVTQLSEVSQNDSTTMEELILKISRLERVLHRNGFKMKYTFLIRVNALSKV